MTPRLCTICEGLDWRYQLHAFTTSATATQAEAHLVAHCILNGVLEMSFRILLAYMPGLELGGRQGRLLLDRLVVS